MTNMSGLGGEEPGRGCNITSVFFKLIVRPKRLAALAKQSMSLRICSRVCAIMAQSSANRSSRLYYRPIRVATRTSNLLGKLSNFIQHRRVLEVKQSNVKEKRFEILTHQWNLGIAGRSSARVTCWTSGLMSGLKYVVATVAYVASPADNYTRTHATRTPVVADSWLHKQTTATPCRVAVFNARTCTLDCTIAKGHSLCPSPRLPACVSHSWATPKRFKTLKCMSPVR